MDYIKYSMDAWLCCAFIIRFAIQWDVGDHSEGLDLLRDRHQKVSLVGRGSCSSMRLLRENSTIAVNVLLQA